MPKKVDLKLSNDNLYTHNNLEFQALVQDNHDKRQEFSSLFHHHTNNSFPKMLAKNITYL